MPARSFPTLDLGPLSHQPTKLEGPGFIPTAPGPVPQAPSGAAIPFDDYERHNKQQGSQQRSQRMSTMHYSRLLQRRRAVLRAQRRVRRLQFAALIFALAIFTSTAALSRHPKLLASCAPPHVQAKIERVAQMVTHEEQALVEVAKFAAEKLGR